MRLGVLSDLHLGFRRGKATLPDGTNVREADIEDSARSAVRNLLNADVDAILDLGDLAHVPHPSKRAILALIKLINQSDKDWYSVNGNHTLQRSKSDTHLYSVLTELCPRFRGVWEGPALLDGTGVYAVPYAPAEAVLEALDSTPTDAVAVAGHWACDDANWPGEHVPASALPTGVPTLLGHWHTRKYEIALYWEHRDNFSLISEINYNGPAYIGATDRLSWGEAQNNTGCAVFDTETKLLTFIEHKTRPWVDIWVTPEDYLEDDHYEKTQGAIVRVRITATPEQYDALDLVRLKKKLASSLEYQVLRYGKDPEPDNDGWREVTAGIPEHWREHVKGAKLPKGVKRREVENHGLEALE